MEHIGDCDTVREALATVTADAGAAPPDWNMRDLYLQRHSTGERRALMLACLAAVWSARRVARQGFTLTAERLAKLVGHEIRCPWLAANSATLSRKERRKAKHASGR